MNKETLKIQAEDVSKLATDINKKVKEVSGNDETNIETLRELLLQTMEFLSDAHDMRANLSEWIEKERTIQNNENTQNNQNAQIQEVSPPL
tara:strand:- start:1834 stop:2106 length:273 start_codon:yes stop_codon:yes gene_type:complete